MEAITTAPDTALKERLNKIFTNAKITFFSKIVRITIIGSLSFEQNIALIALGRTTIKRSGPGLTIELKIDDQEHGALKRVAHTIATVVDDANLPLGSELKTLMEHDAELHHYVVRCLYEYDIIGGELTELQFKYGYRMGELSPLAILGLFGEAGEVLNEVVFKDEAGEANKVQCQAILAGETADALKKLIRDGLYPVPGIKIQSEDEGKKFDLELADVLYYLNLCALGRNKNLRYYAQLSCEKVKTKGLKPKKTDNDGEKE